ncbi:MAG: tRNA 2-thiouridine(34) synthase MnmA [Lachnospiraceae bacterium]|nr:tRNA 2-thiouridine(34) synthase MnmA [Lachnospiraceae bacterium]
MKKVVVGMSGGVDSSVTAFLLKEQGYDVKGVTMQTWEVGAVHGLALINDAKKVAEALDIPHAIIDYNDVFKKEVIDYFVAEYLNGRTPNPCTVCNRFVKWESLLKYCHDIGADYVATGHYAQVRRISLISKTSSAKRVSPVNKTPFDANPPARYTLKKSSTTAKDQTYALYNLTQEQLSKTLMPLGEYTKDEVRQIARHKNIPVADKPDSQEICFIPDDDYAGFITRNAASSNLLVPPPGNFVTTTGEILGIHKGITHYTIGQRKGLGLAMGHHVFVTEIRPATNEVVIGENEDVFSAVLKCNRLNFMGMADLPIPRKVTAKIRYAHQGEKAEIKMISADEILCTFENPVRAITPGQAVVFYEGDYVLGGGTIC